MISGQSALALRTLRALSRTSRSLGIEHLAVAVGTSPDVLLELFAPVTHAGWVERDAAASMFRYTRPVPPPTVHEVVDAVEGTGVIDDCVLRPGVSCAALQGAEVCGDHAAWGRLLNENALLAVPLVAIVRGPAWHVTDRREVVRPGSGRLPADPTTPATAGLPAPAAPPEAPASTTAGPDDPAPREVAP